MSVQILFLTSLTKKNSFSITIPGHWENNFDGKTIDELIKLIDLRSPESHVKEITKRGNEIKIGGNEYKLSDFDTQKNETLEELKNVKYNDVEDLLYRLQLTYDEIIDFLDLKYIPTKERAFP